MLRTSTYGVSYSSTLTAAKRTSLVSSPKLGILGGSLSVSTSTCTVHLVPVFSPTSSHSFWKLPPSCRNLVPVRRLAAADCTVRSPGERLPSCLPKTMAGLEGGVASSAPPGDDAGGGGGGGGRGGGAARKRTILLAARTCVDQSNR